MATKTLEQYQAEEAANTAAENKRLEEEKKREQSSWMGRLWDMMPDMGTMIMWGLVITGLYMFAKSDTGQKFINGLIEKLDPEMQVTVNGFLNQIGLGGDVTKSLLAMDIGEARNILAKNNVPAEVLGVLAKDKATFDTFLTTAQKANGGKAGPSDFTNDKTLFALMTEQPKLVADLAAATIKPGTGQTSDTAKKITASLKTIVGDEARLTTLLNAPHRENTVALLGSMVPAQYKGHITSLIDMGMSNGKPTPAFSAFLGAALTRDDKGNLPDEQKLLVALTQWSETTPALASLLVNIAKNTPASASTTPPATAANAPAGTGAQTPHAGIDSSQLMQAIFTNNGGKAFAAMQAAFNNDDRKIVQLGVIASTRSEIALTRFAVENRKAVEAFRNNATVADLPAELQVTLAMLDKLPATATPALLTVLDRGIAPSTLLEVFQPKGSKEKTINTAHLVDQLFTPQARALIAKAGSENVAALIQATAEKPAEKKLAPLMTKENLDLIVSTAATISTNAKDVTAARDAKLVATALVELIANENHGPIAKLKPENFATFFHDETNAKAVRDLLTNIKGLPVEKRAMADALLKDWQVVQQISSDLRGAKVMIDHLAEKPAPVTAESCKAPGLIGGFIDSTIEKGQFGFARVTGNIVGKYEDELKEIKRTIEKAQCDALPTPAPVIRGGATAAR